MVTMMQGSWAVRGATFALWGLLAGSAAYWALKLGAAPAGPAAAPDVRGVAPADPAAVARLLGASPVAAMAAPVASLSSRFALVGVAAAASHDGAALIAVDGKPAKPFRVGSAVDDALVLKSVDGRRAVLAARLDGPAVLTLELPALRR